ncbi:putative AAA ATPase, partial [Skeletonema marinoi]
MSGRASEHRIPLSELIRSFHTFDYTTASSSLIPALRLTCSLADEILKAKEETGRSPTPRIDWTDSIVVYSQSNRSNQIDFDIDIDIENAFDNILTDDDDDDIRVEILPILFDNTENDERPMDGILYSLVIVFYEIFSGGERPAELEQKQIGETTHGVEPLKEKGVPRSLCDLVAIMLDCANGTLLKDETYQDMSDVRDDLQLMLDKPSIYLHDQDMGRLSYTGLQIGDTLFGRNAELSTIKEAYQRTVAGDNELVTIYGHSGTGKSTLAFEFGNMLELESNSIIHDEGCTNAQNRLQYLLCRFVEVISSTFAATVTLCLDDLQWADSASIAAVNQLLLAGGIASQNAKFFFLGCYREGETDKYNPLWKTLCNNDLVNARSTDVKLDCMDEETLTTMVSETLCLLPRLTRCLSSIIYRKTKGNPLFVSQLMISLGKEGLLRPSLSRRRWEWDKEKIQFQKLPDDVAMFFTNSIEALSEDVKASLCVLSNLDAAV